MKFRPSRKQIILLSLIAAFLILGAVLYRITSLWKPDQSLITLLPNAPIGYISVKDLGGFIETFQRSEFGVQTAQMPILAEIQSESWWRQIVYQKRLWEQEMGGKLDFKKIRGYFGEEAILSFYKRGDEISFLLVSVVGAKEKLEVATLAAADPVNPNYKRLKENYRDLDINTITGYPRDFSYAFIGKIGLLATDKSLIQDTIDIYAKQKQTFTDLQPIGDYLRKRYNTDQNTVYIDPSRSSPILGESLTSLLEGFNGWTFSNRYEKGVIRSRHRFILDANWQPAQRHASWQFTQPDERLLEILPATTAFLSVSSNTHLTTLWKQVDAGLPLEYQQSQIDLSRHLKPGIALALIASPTDAPTLIPSIVLICPIKDQSGLEADLAKLKQTKISLNGKPLRFHPHQDYQGAQLQPVQLPLGFMLSLKGGYACLDKYWVVGTTLGGLKSAIDAFADRESALADTEPPAQLEGPSDGHILIQRNRFIPELKRLIPIIGLIASASGQKIDTVLTTGVANNLFPLAALGPITAGINSDSDFVDVEIRIVLEE